MKTTKRVLSLVLALVMCIGLCACSSNNDSSNDKIMSKEEMLASAQSISFDQMVDVCQNNLAEAKQLYCGKIVKLTGYISSITDEFVELRDILHNPFCVDAYIPLEDLVHLDNRQKITVVGLIDEELGTTYVTIGGTEFESKHFIMRQAYLVESTYTMSVTFKASKASDDSFIVTIPQYYDFGCLYFAEGVEDDHIEANDKLKIEGKIRRGYTSALPYEIYDAKIIQ